MDTSPEELNKLSEDILKSLAVAALPSETEWLLEYRATGKIKPEVWRDLLYLFNDSKLRDSSSLSLPQKLTLLNSLRLYLIQENKPLDRVLFSKKIRPRLNLTREIFLDLQDILNLQKSKKEKFKLTALRKYGPSKDAVFKNQLREEFTRVLKNADYNSALEIILILNFRKNAERKNITREELDNLEKELIAAAGELHLDLAKLNQAFSADRPELRYSYQPPDSKINIVFPEAKK